MFERFTNRARRVLVLAQEEAAALNHSFIGTEHILLGLVHEGEGVGAKALEEVGVGLDGARERVVSMISRGAEPVKDKTKIPFTPRAKKVLELSLREALQLGHNYIGTEHLLLGLLKEGEGVAAQVLREMGVDEDALRKKVIELLAGYASASKVPNEGEDQGFEMTGPARRIRPRARDLAGGSPISTEHLLRALLDEDKGLAAKALSALGVTKESLESALSELHAAGHVSEEVQEVEIAPGVTLKVEHAGFDAEMLKDVVREAIFSRLQQETGPQETGPQETGPQETGPQETDSGGGSEGESAGG